MNLRSFHIVFIVCSTGLCMLFGAWSFRRALAGDSGSWILGALSTVAALALLVYGIWFWREIRTPEQERERRHRRMSASSVLLGVMILGAPDFAHACEVCFGAADNVMIESARVGVFLLLGVVLVVQAAFAVFFVYLRRRARRFGPQQVAPWWKTIEEPLER